MRDEWKNDFLSFHDWAIANGYKEEKTDKGLNILTIDRIDVNGNYEPSNCRFVTNAEQAKNKRNSIPLEEKFLKCPVCGKQFVKKQRNGQKTCSNHCGRILYYREHPNTKDYMKICPIAINHLTPKEEVITMTQFIAVKNVKIYQVRLFGSTTDKPIGLLSGLK